MYINTYVNSRERYTKMYSIYIHTYIYNIYKNRRTGWDTASVPQIDRYCTYGIESMWKDRLIPDWF